MQAVRSLHSGAAWQQALVFGLAVVVGVQGLPLQHLAERVAPTSCVCQELGYCPHAPNGAEGCDHHNHTGEDPSGAASPTEADEAGSNSPSSGAMLSSCDPTPSDAVGPLSPTKWLVSDAAPIPPRPRLVSSTARLSAWASQRVRNDIFRPPRVRPA